MTTPTRLDRLYSAALAYDLSFVSWRPDCNTHRFQFMNARGSVIGRVKTLGAAETWLEAFGLGYLQHTQDAEAEALKRIIAGEDQAIEASLLNRQVGHAVNVAAGRKL